jgi:hypothetical protein
MMFRKAIETRVNAVEIGSLTKADVGCPPHEHAGVAPPAPTAVSKAVRDHAVAGDVRGQ